jgi:hypothetical protein
MSITCGNCTQSLGRAMGCEAKHGTVAEVRACYARKFDFERKYGQSIGTCHWLVQVPTASLYPPEADWYPDSPADVYTVVECGSPIFAVDGDLAEGWFCRDGGHQHLTYGSARQQAEERLEAMVENWASHDANIAGRLDSGESALDIAGVR